MQYTVSILYFLSVLVFGVLASLLWRFRSMPITGPFLWVLGLGGLWALFDGFYVLSDSQEGMLFWSLVKYIPIAFIPMAFFILALRYYKQSHWWDWRVIALLSVVPLLTVFLCLTINPIFTGPIWLDAGPVIPELHYSSGPYYTIHLTYTYAVMAGGFLFLLASLRGAQPLYRRQTLFLLASSMLPMLMDVLSELGLVRWYDPAPLMFAISGLINFWALFHLRVLDIAPIAHSLVIKHMPDLMLVVDDKGRVVDINPAALTALSIDSGRAIGLPLVEVLPQWSDSIMRLHGAASVESARYEVTVAIEGEGRTYDLSVAPIKSGRGETAGHLLLLRDISTHSEVREAYQRANINLQEQLTHVEDLQVQLREQATRDSLTGLFNRRYLEETLHAALASARREHYPVSMIMLDIDHFKQINDTWGHDVGDRVLREVSALLKAQVRAGDIACRYGGEEFIVVLPNASPDVAYRRAEAIRKACRSMRVLEGVNTITCTVSLGVASSPMNAQTAQELTRAADGALYVAKANGRNRTWMLDTADTVTTNALVKGMETKVLSSIDQICSPTTARLAITEPIRQP